MAVGSSLRKEFWRKKVLCPWEPFKNTAVSDLEFDQSLEIDTFIAIALGLGIFNGPRMLKSQFNILPKWGQCLSLLHPLLMLTGYQLGHEGILS